MLQMSKIEIKDCFIDLGKFLNQFSLDKNIKNEDVKNNEIFFDSFVDLIALSQSHNGWFTPEQVYFSIQSFTSPSQDYIFLTFLSWKRDRALSSPVTMELTIEARRHKQTPLDRKVSLQTWIQTQHLETCLKRWHL